MYTYRTNGGKEIRMNENARDGFVNMLFQLNDVLSDCTRAYTDRNIDRLAALTTVLYGRLKFLYCVLNDADKTLLDFADNVYFLTMLAENSEIDFLKKYISEK